MSKIDAHFRTKKRIRRVVNGTSDRPRLAVSKSNRYLFVQLIDDEKKVTLFGLSTKTLNEEKKLKKAELIKTLGEKVAEYALKNKIKSVVFDRGGYRYAGNVKIVAESAREKGLII